MKKIIFPLGIFSVAVYIVTVIIAGFSKPGYSQIWNTVSMLVAKGETTRPVVTVSFAFTYLSLLIIAIYSFSISRTKITKLASALLSLTAISSLIQLFLPMDPWRGIRTMADKIHDWITVGIALSIIVAIFLFALKSAGFFRRISFWAGWLITIFSILAGWFLLTWNFHLLSLFERLWILTFLIWTIYFSYYLSGADYEANS